MQAVTDATLDVMADKGFADFTISDVAARAGVNEASIYRRWGGRDNLIVETLLAHSRRTIPVPDTGSIRTDLTDLTCAVADYLTTPAGKAWSHVLASSGDETRWAQIRFDFWNTRLNTMRITVDRAVERQEIPADTDPRLVLEALIAPLQFRTLVTRETFDHRFCRQLVQLVLDGISHPKHKRH
ncbi:MAG: TetR/AcrR family transcriptional regulator [Mycobacterium sp.]